jgi:uncharacterized membrane protein
VATLNETARVEAFSDAVFAIAITLLVLEVRVPPVSDKRLAAALMREWPSYLAFLASFMTIGTMWLSHHRLFTLIKRSDDGLILINLALLMGVTWIPFPTALVAEHLRAESSTAAVLYAGSFTALAMMYNLMWRYAVRTKLCAVDLNVAAITRQYAVAPIMYLAIVGVAFINGTVALVACALYALYFSLPPSLWRRRRRAA